MIIEWLKKLVYRNNHEIKTDSIDRFDMFASSALFCSGAEINYLGYNRVKPKISNVEILGGGKTMVSLKAEFPPFAEKSEIVIDEFLDSAEAHVATYLGPDILNDLARSEATVFVSSHRAHSYRRLAEQGWTIMSPDYEIVKERKPVFNKSTTTGQPDL